MMRYSGSLVAALGACVVIWHESAENPAVFCYRIGMGAWFGIRSRAMAFAPAANLDGARDNYRWLNRSGISCIRSTMFKD